MDQAEITAIIPCYNGAGHLDGAIASALDQSHVAVKIVVVDDGSTDRSVAIAQSYAARGWPVRYVRTERNSGPASARNIGIAETTTPFVAFLDADDRWTRDHCKSLLALLTRFPDVDLAFARTRSTDSQVGESAQPIPVERPMEMLEYLLDDSFIPQSAVLARRSSILAAGGYTDGMRYSEDYDLWLRMAHGRRFIASGAASCIRTSHPAQATRQAERMYRGAWEARARYSEFARRAGPVISPGQYTAICARAYERDLADAWRSRSLPLLWNVLGLAHMVPGGRPIRRRWLARAGALWPLWRLGALCWDALPGSWRRRIKPGRSQRLGPVLSPGE